MTIRSLTNAVAVAKTGWSQLTQTLKLFSKLKR